MLVDCDNLDSGCNGGLEEEAYTWIKKNGGIMFDSDYPYTGRKGTCKSVASKYADFKVTGFKKLGSSSSVYSCADEEEMKEFLYENGNYLLLLMLVLCKLMFLASLINLHLNVRLVKLIMPFF